MKSICYCFPVMLFKMVENLLLSTMRPIFYLKSLFGASTVSLKSLKQSTFKSVYTGAWIVVYLIECVAFLRNIYVSMYSNTSNKNFILDYLTRFAGYIITFYMLFMSISDYKTFLSSALNIQTAIGILKSERIKITPIKRATLIIIILVILLKSLMIFYYGIFTWILSQNVEAVTSYVTALHFYGSQLLMIVVFATFKFKTNRIYESLNRANEALKLQCNCMMTVNENISQQNLEPNLKSAKSFVLTKKIRGAMNYIDGQIVNYCWPFLAWMVLAISLSSPVLIYQFLIEPYKIPTYKRSHIALSLLVMDLVLNPVHLLALIHLSEVCVEECHVTVETLFELATRRKGNKRRRYLKHQTLATIHRSSLTSCYFFDLDYSLGMDIVDTAVLVITTLNG